MIVDVREGQDFTAEVLTELLQDRHPGAVVASRTVLRTHQGSCSHVWLEVTYAAEGAGSGLPTRLFVKTQLDSVKALPPEMAVSLQEGGRTTVLFRNETGFFRDLAPQLDVEMPRMLAATALPGRQAMFVLLGEDLTHRGATFVDPVEPVSVERVRAVLLVLAGMHATYWGSALLQSGDLPWLESPLQGQTHENLQGEAFDVIRLFLQLPEKAAALQRAGLSVDTLEQAFWLLQDRVAEPPLTLLHGDPHPGNVYFLPDGSAGLIDWQLVRKGSWVHDVAYCIVGALAPDDRRAHERELLAGYLAQLAAAGVTDPPDQDTAWELYRCSPVWGFPMWAITPSEMYTPGAVEAVLSRFAEAIVDLRTLDALGL